MNGHGIRLCVVNEKMGFFHTWEHYSRPMDASPFVGGAPAGVYSEVFGIVEFADGTKRVNPADIDFCDDKNSILSELETLEKLRKETRHD